MWYPPGQLSLQLVPYSWVLLSHVLGKYEPTEGLGSAGHVISGTVNNKSYFEISKIWYNYNMVYKIVVVYCNFTGCVISLCLKNKNLILFRKLLLSEFFFNFFIQLLHVYSKKPKSVLIFFHACGLSNQRPGRGFLDFRLDSISTKQ